MNDEQLEEALRRYAPRPPAPSLHRRVRSTTRLVPLRLVDWALLAAAASLAILAAWPASTVEAGRDPVAAGYRQQLAEVAAALGGDAQAQELALVVVSTGQATVQGQTTVQENQR